MAEKTIKERLATIEEIVKNTDKKVDGVNTRLDTINGRSFKNSTDIAKMKGQSGVIAFVVSLIVSVVGIYFGTKK